MGFRWPWLLSSLLAVPALVALYVALIRRRNKRAAELAAKGFTPTAQTRRLRRLRHIPFVFFLAGLSLLLFSLARPHMNIGVPRREGTVILAFDVSNSMRADDLKPTRMEAAKVAAAAFVEKQPSEIIIGVVAFSDGSIITQQPTKERVITAIKALRPQGGTSLGQGIFTALNAIAGGTIKIDPAALAGDPGGAGTGGAGGAAGGATPPASGTNVDNEATSLLDNVDIGYYGSAAIVLLSDGENTSEPDPKALGELASVAGVKIYTIGIGSKEGAVVEIDGFNIATALDEELLEAVADVSDGKYFLAEDATSLASVYDSIDLQWKTVRERTELTSIAAAASAALIMIGAALSLRWLGRLL
jgi:Ca-activated chloride channel homolog